MVATVAYMNVYSKHLRYFRSHHDSMPTLYVYVSLSLSIYIYIYADTTDDMLYMNGVLLLGMALCSIAYHDIAWRGIGAYDMLPYGLVVCSVVCISMSWYNMCICTG